MDSKDIDKWVEDNDCFDAALLLDEKLPKMRGKLNRLDKRIRELLEEVKQEFPEAQYYTASGGFNLVLGETHDFTVGSSEEAQRQRLAWSGKAQIGDGDF